MNKGGRPVGPEVLSHRQIGKRSKIINGASIDGRSVPMTLAGSNRRRGPARVPRQHVEVDAEFITGRCVEARGLQAPSPRAPCDGSCGSGLRHRIAAAS